MDIKYKKTKQRDLEHNKKNTLTKHAFIHKISSILSQKNIIKIEKNTRKTYARDNIRKISTNRYIIDSFILITNYPET